METTNETVAPVHYAPSQLVTYKSINDGEATYPTIKVSDLEWKLEQIKNTERTLAGLNKSVNALENSLSGWIENEDSADTIVSEICNIFGFNPVKEIEFEGTIQFSGTIQVPLSEVADFDIDSVDFNIDVNSYSHDVYVDNIEVEHVSKM